MNTKAKKILVIDNHDSFVFNLVQYLNEIGADTTVVKNDEVKPSFAKNFAGVLISPGPGTPEKAGASIEVTKFCEKHEIPLFGVCLGVQVIATTFGAKVSSAPELMHGRTSKIQHNGKSIFSGIPNNFQATRYHSLAIERGSIPQELEIIATSQSGIIMGISHRDLNIVGVQFHPEAVLTQYGYELIANWLVICGDLSAPERAAGLSPMLSNN